MERRSPWVKQQQVTDYDVEHWVVDEQWAADHLQQMTNAAIEWGHNTATDETDDVAKLGLLPLEQMGLFKQF